MGMIPNKVRNTPAGIKLLNNLRQTRLQQPTLDEYGTWVNDALGIGVQLRSYKEFPSQPTLLALPQPFEEITQSMHPSIKDSPEYLPAEQVYQDFEEQSYYPPGKCCFICHSVSEDIRRTSCCD
jgi:hypothetical protein